MSVRRLLIPFLFFLGAFSVAGFAVYRDYAAANAALTAGQSTLVRAESERLRLALGNGPARLDKGRFIRALARLGEDGKIFGYLLVDRDRALVASQGGIAFPALVIRAALERKGTDLPVRDGYAVYDAQPAAGGMSVIVGMDGAPDAARLKADFRTHGYEAAGFALAVALLLALALYASVDRRLARIGSAISRFAEGDGSVRAGLSGWDPVARLGRMFDDMASRIGQERSNLAESEERLKFALHGSNAGIWDWRIDTGHTYYSPRWKRLLGFSEEEVLPHSEEWLKRVHPDDLPGVMARLKGHMTGPSPFFESEHRLRNKEGDYVWVLERGVVLHDNEGKAYRMVGALTDISRRKEIESALLRSEEAYRSVVNAVSQVIFRCDAEGRLTFLNPAWNELTGRAVRASLRHRLAEFVSADDQPKAMRLLAGVAGSESDAVSGEIRLLTQDGGTRWFNLHARALPAEPGSAQVAGLLTDIDALKRAQDALIQSNKERNTILDLSPDGFVFFDKGKRVVYVNPAFSAMTGIARDRVVGKPLAVLREAVAALLDPAHPAPNLADHPDDARILLNLAKPARLVLALLTRSIHDPQGGLLAGILYLRDVTTQVEIDRMKNEFLSTAAHELRTPMASIYGFSELLLVRDFDAATRHDLLQRIHRQTKNLITLVNELLDLARIEARGGKSFKFKQAELATVVRTALHAFYVPQETHALSVDIPDHMATVNVDPGKFQQVLANVLSNALKYSPNGGEIEVASRRRTTDRGQEFMGIVVRDRGMGMTADQVARIFDRFYRADTSGAIPGTGLGMCLVREIMEVLEGEVEVESHPGEGTAVTLWLPVAATETEPAANVG